MPARRPKKDETGETSEDQKGKKSKETKTKKEPAKTKKEPSKTKKVVIDDDKLTEKLKLYVSEEIWSSWSPIRRESFKQIMTNPNTFFYRNRPPNDPQKYGAFTQEEEELFIKRVNYFRHDLKIDDGLWGLFSVPIRGRLGYQCSNFYRQLIRDGKIKDSRYEIASDGKLKFKHGPTRPIDPSAIEILEKEAMDFINECLVGDGTGATPQVSAPIRVDSDRPVQYKRYKDRTGGPKCLHRPSQELMNLFGRRRKLAEKKFNPLSDTEVTGGKNAPRSRRDQRSLEDESTRCPLYGALDPMSGEPMTSPMMDENGFVMDLKSWRRVFRYGEAPPCEQVAMDEDDLVELTAGNFNDFRLHIVNIAC